MTTAARAPDIPGTTLFDGTMARKGYALNKMCYSFNQAANRDAFVRDEAGLLRAVRAHGRAAGGRAQPQRARSSSLPAGTSTSSPSWRAS